jgi:hypothetical protein
LVGQRRARRRSLYACLAADQVCCRPSCQPRTANVRPSRPRQARFQQRRSSRSPTTAIRPTRYAKRGRSRAPTPSRIQRGADSAAAVAADTGRLSVRTPRSHRSPGHRSPGHRTSARPVGRTLVRMADSGRGQSDERRGRRPDILDGHDDGDRRRGGPTWLGLQRLRRSATYDGSGVTTPAAAVTRQLRSTAQ